MVFESFLDPIFSPLLNIPILVAITIVSFGISLLISVIYKYTTDQTQMKALKEEIKKGQEKMKKHKKDPEKMLKEQKKVMDANMKYMTMSMKPTLFTFLPIILIFGWLNGHLAYDPLMPNQPFTVSAEISDSFSGNVTLHVDGLEIITDASLTPKENMVSWELKGPPGLYTLMFSVNGKDEVNKQIIITEERKYAPVEDRYKDSQIKSVKIHNQKVQPLQSIPLVKNIPWIGKFGWLGTYILLSIIFSMTIRKVMGLS
jgi:uncharacterized membrane protein (DUF106 family)